MTFSAELQLAVERWDAAAAGSADLRSSAPLANQASTAAPALRPLSAAHALPLDGAMHGASLCTRTPSPWVARAVRTSRGGSSSAGMSSASSSLRPLLSSALRRTHSVDGGSDTLSSPTPGYEQIGAPRDAI